MPNEDKQLLEQIAGGDVKALGILYVLYAGRIRNFAFSMLQNSAEAEDITQDIFLKIWNSRVGLREVDSLKSYLFCMAHNAVLNFIKRKGVRDRYRKVSASVETGLVSMFSKSSRFASDGLSSSAPLSPFVGIFMSEDALSVPCDWMDHLSSVILMSILSIVASALARPTRNFTLAPTFSRSVTFLL